MLPDNIGVSYTKLPASSQWLNYSAMVRVMRFPWYALKGNLQWRESYQNTEP